MLSELTVAKLLERTAAGTPVPGGGSLSAMAAAAGAALVQMVANLTTGRAQFASVAGEMATLAAEADRLRAELQAAMDRDAAAYTAVLQAFRLPRETADDERQRTEAIQTAMREAARAPLAVAEQALSVMALAGKAVRHGNPNAAADGAVGALLARAALEGALFNVRVNLRDIRDEDFAARLQRNAEALEDRARTLETAIRGAFER